MLEGRNILCYLLVYIGHAFHCILNSIYYLVSKFLLSQAYHLLKKVKKNHINFIFLFEFYHIILLEKFIFIIEMQISDTRQTALCIEIQNEDARNYLLSLLIQFNHGFHPTDKDGVSSIILVGLFWNISSLILPWILCRCETNLGKIRLKVPLICSWCSNSQTRTEKVFQTRFIETGLSQDIDGSRNGGISKSTEPYISCAHNRCSVLRIYHK